MAPASGDWRARYRQATVGFPQWSTVDPDRLFFVSDEGGVTQVWTSHLGTGDRRQLTHQHVGVEEFVVSPVGDGVAWWSDSSGDGNGGWVVTTVDSNEPKELLTGLRPGWSEGIAWCGERAAIALSDGETYAVYVGVPGAQGRLVYESRHPAGLGQEWTTSPGGLSTDGALVCLRHSESGDMLHFGLRVLRADDGEPVGEVMDAGHTLRVAAWSPIEGDPRVAIVHERDGIERPAIWNPLTGERAHFGCDLPGEITVDGWYPDATALLVTHWHEGASQLLRLDISSGAYTLVYEAGGYISDAAVRPDGSVWVRDESGTRSPSTHTISGQPVLAPLTPPIPGVAHTSLKYVGPSGEPTHLMLATPPGPGPHPIVMHVHGGPEWAESNRYDPWAAALVEHGVAIAKVNYRGSTGFGEAWRTAIHGGNIGRPEVSDVVSGLRHLIDIGVADPRRCAIEGWSWGGYVAALAIGLEPDTFSAAIAGIPVCDSVMTHEDCSPSQQAYDIAIMGGSPSELPDLYASISPSTHLDAVRTPLLIIAGEHDSACPIRQVRWYARELEERGRSVRLHTYDAGHHANSVDERILHVELMLEFLDEQGIVSHCVHGSS